MERISRLALKSIPRNPQYENVKLETICSVSSPTIDYAKSKMSNRDNSSIIFIYILTPFLSVIVAPIHVIYSF